MFLVRYHSIFFSKDQKTDGRLGVFLGKGDVLLIPLASFIIGGSFYNWLKLLMFSRQSKDMKAISYIIL